MRYIARHGESRVAKAALISAVPPLMVQTDANPEGLPKSVMGDALSHYDGIVAFSQTDFTEDLKKITVPVLVMHSEDDQIVPYVAAGPKSAALLKHGTLKTYHGFPHGMSTTHADTINADLLAFLKA